MVSPRGLPGRELRRLQLVQNTAAKIVTLTKKLEHIKLVLKNLNWLPVKDHTDQKILSQAYNCLSGTAPQYLETLVPRYEPLRSLSVSPLSSNCG